MRKAHIRFEDISPGGNYNTEESLLKLKVISDYLKSEAVQFSLAFFPRFLDPPHGYDKSILNTNDPFITSFNNTINYICNNGGALDLHGFTHQYAQGVSGIAHEFYSSACVSNCPPQDPSEACTNRGDLEMSYASSRIRSGFEMCIKGGLKIESFETSHYSASTIERSIIESWVGVLHENVPGSTTGAVTVLDKDNAFYRGVIYIPTPLGYIKGQGDVDRICEAIVNFPVKEIPAFFFHAYLEFPFIHIKGSTITYDNNSYLKQLIRCFKQNNYSFVSLNDFLSFTPSVRQTYFFPGTDYTFFTGDINGDSKTEFIIWHPQTGTWYYALPCIEPYPSRHNIGFTINRALNEWPKGTNLKPFIGDFNGDGKDDIVVRDSVNGIWQVALSQDLYFMPTPIWLSSWGIGDSLRPFIGDFNGDGKDDIAIWNPATGGWQVALSTGESFIPNSGPSDCCWLKPWAVGCYWTPLVGDFNGDGRDDIVVWDYSSGEWHVVISSGTCFIPSKGSSEYIWLNNWGIGKQWKPFAGDFNGDGIDDILIVDIKSGIWQVALSDGNKFTPLDRILSPWAQSSDAIPFVGDMNGDGKVDICVRQPNLRGGTVDIALSVIN